MYSPMLNAQALMAAGHPSLPYSTGPGFEAWLEDVHSPPSGPAQPMVMPPPFVSLETFDAPEPPPFEPASPSHPRRRRGGQGRGGLPSALTALQRHHQQTLRSQPAPTMAPLSKVLHQFQLSRAAATSSPAGTTPRTGGTDVPLSRSESASHPWSSLASSLGSTPPLTGMASVWSSSFVSPPVSDDGAQPTAPDPVAGSDSMDSAVEPPTPEDAPTPRQPVHAVPECDYGDTLDWNLSSPLQSLDHEDFSDKFLAGILETVDWNVDCFRNTVP
eukprot:EG_transcript_3331